ncbi:hypothetical protein Anas_00718 [Armadillidium nasatum]|uniref:Uncharacterized protein n=1 Tax=Armadillidium nasatum TaxID=96803 RepID=A0A5N5T390_9CRUS|nr:hypothetical protein Anas_00718 [Armadillidium nasatum]
MAIQNTLFYTQSSKGRFGHIFPLYFQLWRIRFSEINQYSSINITFAIKTRDMSPKVGSEPTWSTAVQHERAPRSIQKRPLFGTDLASVGTLAGSLLGSGVPSPLPALPPYYPGFFSPSAFKPGSLSHFLPPAPPLPPLTLTLSHNSAFRPSSTAAIIPGVSKSQSSSSIGIPHSPNVSLSTSSLAFLSSSANTASFISSLSPSITSTTSVNCTPTSASFLQPYSNAFVGAGIGLLYTEQQRLHSQNKIPVSSHKADITTPIRSKCSSHSGFAPPFTAENLAKPLRPFSEYSLSGECRPSPSSEHYQPPLKKRKNSGGEEEVTSSGNLCSSPDPKTPTKVNPSSSTPNISVSQDCPPAVSTTGPPNNVDKSGNSSSGETDLKREHKSAGERSVNNKRKREEDSSNNNYIAKLIPQDDQSSSVDSTPSETKSLPPYSPSPPHSPGSSITFETRTSVKPSSDVEGNHTTPSPKNVHSSASVANLEEDNISPSTEVDPVVESSSKKVSNVFSSSEKPSVFSSSNEGGPCEVIHESAARLLFLGVKWARSIPAFMQANIPQHTSCI